VGLSIEVRMPDGKIRSYSFVDESDPTYWSTIRFGPRKTMHTKPIEAGQQIGLVINLRDLTDSQGAKLTSLKGVHSLRPVLTAAGAAGKWWLGSSTGPWIAVKIGKQPGMAGKWPVFFTPAGRKPAAATRPAKAFKASFETLTVEIISTWTWNRTITIKGDGSYTFNPHNPQRLKKAPVMKPLEMDPNRYVATYRIGPAHLRQLDKLLGATGWLTRGGKVEPRLKDRTYYALALARGGKTITTACYGDQEQAYTDLVRFLRRISNQEWLLYQLGKDAGYRFKPEHAIGLQLDAAVAKPGTRKPHDPVLDFHRFVGPMAVWLAAPGGRKSSELITAAKLMGYLKIESQRKNLKALAANRKMASRVRQEAIRALSRLGRPVFFTPAGRKPAAATQPADAQVKTDWSAAQEGVAIRLRAARKTWRADEIPALRWDVRNTGARQFLHVAAGQRLAQLEVDGVWHQWPVSLRRARLADLGAGQSLENQLVTVSPIWSPAKPQELQWKSRSSAIPIPAKVRPSLQLSPGKHTVRLAVIADPSRAKTGKGFRVVSQPLEITVTALPAGRAAVWPSNGKLAQAVKDALYRTQIVWQESLRPRQPNMKDWIARALSQAEKAAALAEKTPLHTSTKRLADALAALQKAVSKEDPAEAGDEFAEAGKAHDHLVSVFTGEVPLPAPTTRGATPSGPSSARPQPQSPGARPEQDETRRRGPMEQRRSRSFLIGCSSVSSDRDGRVEAVAVDSTRVEILP